MSATIARIAVSAAPFVIDRPYDYTVPDELARLAVPGARVCVPFGRGNKEHIGVILSLYAEGTEAGSKGGRALKAICSFPDESPVFDGDSIKLAVWMSDRFFCTVFDAFRVMLPAGMWFDGGKRRVSDKRAVHVELNISEEEAEALAAGRKKTAPRQAEILRRLLAVGGESMKDLLFVTGAETQTVRTLERQGVVSLSEREVFRRPSSGLQRNTEHVSLSGEQQLVFDRLKSLIRSGKPEAALLYGVTGSGKTLVYIELIKEILDIGKTAIVLVPEIALTPQTVGIFSSYFGDLVAVMHSALGGGERLDEWKRIRAGTVKVVVGTRSAVFAPLKNLGLIVIDEEQEHTYKSDIVPRYHARDIAKFRVARTGALLLLSSATPSVESMHSVKSGKYSLLKLPNRYSDRRLPEVVIADMRQELQNGNGGSISGVMRRELTRNIQNGEQSILFINRRGTNPFVTCMECGFTFKCSSCSVSMTYHSAGDRLLCHYCGYSQSVPDKCPDCGGKLKYVGAGTQKVESELKEMFPGTGIIRMDADTVTRKDSHKNLFTKFVSEKVPILLGTQMVTKGLDFENVTLVGVISADASLYTGDYRAGEKTFSLITQVIGRAGRGQIAGRAIIQTFSPDHDIITLASRQDYDGFYDREIVLRKALGSPPVRDLLSLTATGTDETQVMTCSSIIRVSLENYLGGDSGVKLLGPAPPAVLKVKNAFRYRVLVSAENTKAIRDTIAHTIREFSRDKRGYGVSVYADAYTYE